MSFRHIRKAVVFIGILVISVSGCAPAKKTLESEEQGQQIELGERDLRLVDYLRRVQGLNVMEVSGIVTVVIRGVTSLSGDIAPLYVVNGSRIGTSYVDAEGLVDVRDIVSVSVLRSSEAMTRYGMVASNGAIIIETEQ